MQGARLITYDALLTIYRFKVKLGDHELTRR